MTKGATFFSLAFTNFLFCSYTHHLPERLYCKHQFLLIPDKFLINMIKSVTTFFIF